MRPKRRYEIHRRDAFVWLAQRKPESIHAVVADPPYGIIEYMPKELKKMNNSEGGIWRLPHNYDGNQRSPVPRFTVLRSKDYARIVRFHNRLAPLLYRVLVPGGHVFLASQNLFMHLVTTAFSQAGFEVRGQIIRVVKTLRGGDRPKGAHDEFPDVSVTPRTCWEPWLIFRKACEGLVRENLRTRKTGALRRPTKDTPFCDLIMSSRAGREERAIAPHPSLKPQEFMRQLVWASLPLGKGIILDPFMGSGSTIAAAENHKLRSIGLEISTDYFRLAKRAIPKLAALQVNGYPRKEHRAK